MGRRVREQAKGEVVIARLSRRREYHRAAPHAHPEQQAWSTSNSCYCSGRAHSLSNSSSYYVQPTICCHIARPKQPTNRFSRCEPVRHVRASTQFERARCPAPRYSCSRDEPDSRRKLSGTAKPGHSDDSGRPGWSTADADLSPTTSFRSSPGTIKCSSTLNEWAPRAGRDAGVLPGHEWLQYQLVLVRRRLDARHATERESKRNVRRHNIVQHVNGVTSESVSYISGCSARPRSLYTPLNNC